MSCRATSAAYCCVHATVATIIKHTSMIMHALANKVIHLPIMNDTMKCICREQAVVDLFEANTYSVVNVVDVTLQVRVRCAGTGMCAFEAWLDALLGGMRHRHRNLTQAA